jgi:hypothetical protein
MTNTNCYKYMPQTEENNGRWGGGSVDSAKTSPSLPGTTSGIEPPGRRRGAQRGNRQALKHGAYTGEKLALRRYISDFIRRTLDAAEAVDVRYGGKPRRRRRKAAEG